MSTSTIEPQTIAELGGDTSGTTDPKGEVFLPPEPKKKSKLARAERFFASVLETSPPSEVESLKDDVRKLKESVEALRNAYNRHHHSHLDGSQTSPTSVEV